MNCSASSTSTLIPGHTHTCNGAHLDDDLHKCSGCRRWFAGRAS